VATSCIWVNIIVKSVIIIKLPSESSDDRESKIRGNLSGTKEGRVAEVVVVVIIGAYSSSSVAVAAASIFLLFLFLLPL